jgi:Holliday junction DNA helicase RuvA
MLELKDKLGVDLGGVGAVNRAQPASSDVLHALLALGYNEREAVAAVKQMSEGISVSDGIKQALKLLSKA